MTRSLAGLVLFLCACQSLAPPNAGATLRARERQILAEASAIARAAGRDAQRARATVEMRRTEIAAMQQGNAALLVTVRAGDAPGQRVAGVEVARPVLTPGQRWFAKTGISRFINNANGCVVSPQISFADDADILYVTLRAWNVRAGLQLSVQWWHEGEPMHGERYVLPRDDAEGCYWFSLTPDMVPFMTGSWSVQVYAGGAPLESPQSFAMREAEAMMDDG